MLRLLTDENFNGDIVNDRYPVGRAIDEILLMVACSEQPEWSGRAVYIPL
jgi:hypothetical protein